MRRGATQERTTCRAENFFLLGVHGLLLSLLHSAVCWRRVEPEKELVVAADVFLNCLLSRSETISLVPGYLKIMPRLACLVAELQGRRTRTWSSSQGLS